MKIPEFLREPIQQAQVRLEQLEEELQRILKDLMDRGRAGRKDLEHIVTKLSKQDWTFPELKERLEKLRDQSAERAAEWREKAESFRVEALERVMELQTKAIQFLGVATRDQVDELSRHLDRLSRRLERNGRPRKGKKTRPRLRGLTAMPDIQELFKEAWSAAIAGVNAAEQEAERVLTRLADVAGLSPDDVRRHAREFGERLATQRREIEKAIDDAVRRAVNRFRLPSQEELAALEKRLDAIAERVDSLAKERGA